MFALLASWQVIPALPRCRSSFWRLSLFRTVVICDHTKDKKQPASRKQPQQQGKVSRTRRQQAWCVDGLSLLPCPVDSYPSCSPSAVARVSVYAPPARERSRAAVGQCEQSWRRSRSRSGSPLCLRPGVSGWLGMDGSSALSKYPSGDGGSGRFCPFRVRGKKRSAELNDFSLLSQQRRSQEHDLAASRQRGGGADRTQENSG